MAFDFGSFVNTGQFSDPANYSGLGGQMPSVKEVAEKVALASMTGGASEVAGGIAPPDQSFGDAMMDYGKKAVDPYAQKFDQFSNAASQAGQGNFGNAFNAAVGRKVATQQTVDPNASSGGGLKTPTYQYSHVWEDTGH